MKKFKSTYAFALFVMALGAYTYFVEFKKFKKEGGEDKDTVKLLSEVKEEEITEFHVTKGDDKKTFVKKDGTWLMTAPVEDKADKFHLENTLKNVIGEKQTEITDEDGKIPDLKSFGFDKPAGSIEIKTAAKTYKFVVGAEKSFDGRGYHIKLEGQDKIYLTGANFGDVLDKPAKELRSKDIVPEDINPTSIRLELSGESPVILEKDGDAWVYQPKKDLKLDPKIVNDFISNLKFFKARDFASENDSAQELNKYNLNSPFIRVKAAITAKEGDTIKSKELELLVSKEKDGKAFAKTNLKPVIYEVAAGTMENLKKKLDDFRDKKFPFTFDEKDVQQIEIERSKLRLSLKSNGGKWEAGSEQKDKELDAAKVPQLITQIRELSADRFVKGNAPRGLNQPANKIVLKAADGKSVLEIAWGEKFKDGADEFYFIKTNLSSEIMGIRANKIDELPGENLFKAKTEGQNNNMSKAEDAKGKSS